MGKKDTNELATMIASGEGNCMSERLGGGRRDLLFIAYTFLNFINVHVLSIPKKVNI